MAVLWVREHWPQRGGGFAHPLQSAAARHFTVATTNSGNDEFTIGLSGLLPSYLSAHPADLAHTMRKLDFRQRAESPWLWDVTANYSSEPLREETYDVQASPLLRPAKMRIRTVRRERSFVNDRDGNPLINSATDSYEPVILGVSDWTIDVEKNVYPLPSWVFAQTDGKPRLNSDTLVIARYGLSCAAETVKLDELEVEDLQMLAGVYFFPMRFSLAYRADGWAWDVTDKGFNKVGAFFGDGTIELVAITIKSDKGQPVRPNSPVFLDGGGQPLPAKVQPDQVVYNTFNLLPTMDMSALPLT